MGLWQRFKLIFASKANKALNKAEDPRETLDYSYEKQLELLQKVRRGVADVATSRKRIELQIQNLAQQTDKLTAQAKAALAGGREDLAREALTRKSGLQTQIADLQTQLAQLQEQEEKLIGASQQLQAKVDAFRTKKETIKATYSAAEAQTKINEAFAAVGIVSMRALDVSPDIVNVNGGAIALGHPIGMSGARLVLHLAHELRRRGGGLGAAALCGGGGQGDALIVSVPPS